MGKIISSRVAHVVENLERRVLLSSTHFAVLGDFGTNSVQEGDVANRIKSWSPDYIVTVGDNNYPSGAASTIDTVIGQYYHDYIYNYQGTYGAGSATQRFFATLGNHDWGDIANNPTGANPYLAYFTLPGDTTPASTSGNERYYDFTKGPVHFFVVDSDANEPDGNTSTGVQATWLKNQLAAATEPWKFVVFHHAAYSSSASTANMQWPFAAWGANGVLAGHQHNYERLFENGIPYFVDGLGGGSLVGFSTPIAGSQVRYSSDYGAMLVDANDTSVTFQFITRTGSVIDTYTMSNLLTAPTGLSATTVSSSQIKLNWTDVTTAEDGYKIERSTDNINFSQVGTVAANTLTYTDQTGLAPGTLYYYRVRGSKGATVSTPSNSASATTSASTTATLVAGGSNWKYLDTGISLDAQTWKSSGFNDTGWKSGPAQLGYGDGDEKTLLAYGPDINNKYTTTYFRQAFNVANKDAFSSLNLRLLRDDGAVVYLNGTEVFRSNMPSGTITSATFAVSVIGGTDESTFYPATISPSLLVNGTNELAVELHQANGTSSDLSFDASLTGATRNLPLVWADRDIGSVGAAGNASAAGGVFTVTGSGADIWGTADAFNFVYQPWTGDGSIVARVAAVQNTNSWAKAGVMFRETLTANAKAVDMLVTPGQGETFQRRTPAGGSTVNTVVAGIKAPSWVKLIRAGNVFTAYRSSDGVGWTLVGSATVSMSQAIYVGLALTAHDNTKLNTSIFDSVTVSASTSLSAKAATTAATNVISANAAPASTRPAAPLFADDSMSGSMQGNHRRRSSRLSVRNL